MRTIKTNHRTWIAAAAAVALFTGTQTFAPAQSRQPPAQSKQPPAQSKQGGSSASDGSSSSSSSSSSGSAQQESRSKSSDKANQNQTKPNAPTTPADTRRPFPTDTRRPLPADNRPFPGNTQRPPIGRNPPPTTGPNRRPINNQRAQQPIIILPSSSVAGGWPWWYSNYFPTYSSFGSAYDQYAGGWYDDNYNEQRTADRAANRPNYDPIPPSAPAPAVTGDPEADPAYRQAVAEVASAQAAYDEASREVLERLKKDNSKYRQLLEEKAQAARNVEDAQEAVPASSVQPAQAAPAGTDPARVAPAAQKKLELNTRITQMEQEAIRNDPDASAARKALEGATAKVNAMRKAVGPAQGRANAIQ